MSTYLERGPEFREALLVNKVVLAKQVCRLANQPQSIMSRTPKANTFPKLSPLRDSSNH